MPWQNNSGGGGPWGGGGGRGSGGGGGQSPWGRPSGGGGGGGGGGNRPPPDVEEMVRKGQERLKSMLPGGMGTKGIFLLGAVVVAGWLLTGFYQVEPNEQGVELVFGKLSETTGPGLNYNYPAPIGTVLKPRVTDVNQEQIGFRASGSGTRASSVRDVPAESLMLTGDENIIDIQAVVFWQIGDAGSFLFNIDSPQETVRNAAEAAIREVIGKTDFEFARTSGRSRVAAQVQELIQSILDEYSSGIIVSNVQLQKVDPPGSVINAFRDVQAARADAEKVINEANAYSKEITQRAEGQSQQIKQAAEAYKEERTAAATGDAQRFLSIYNEYVNAKDITKRRIYLQTMEEILRNMDKVLIENEEGSNVLPYLPLDKLTGDRERRVVPANPNTADGLDTQ